MRTLKKIWEFIKSLFCGKTPTKPIEPDITPIKREEEEEE